ncbi:MAG TPA: GTP-binding protein [Streptosporangiaceae bacterium]|nr:GTP-binding protein [Streptosporangiaceae bacterium]
MQVVATAGHTGHGKSSLVHALTGTTAAGPEAAGPDAAWATLPSGRRVAFVDAPGDERSVPAVLAGLGTASAVMVVVAADEGWLPRSAEHLSAIDALGLRAGLLVVTRADLAGPTPALRQARAEIARTCLAGAESVVVSTRTGEGMSAAVAALDRLAQRLPPSDPDESVRLWVDGVSAPAGDARFGDAPFGDATAGDAVVTGTLTAGTIRVGDELSRGDRADRTVRVRAVRAPGGDDERVSGVSRVALTLSGAAGLVPGTPLVAAGRWTYTTGVDVRHGFGAASGRLARQLILHIGSAAVPVRLRPLGPDTARLTLNTRLPLHVGDRALLRDPQRRVVAGVSVLDVRPPPLTRRGAAGERARELAQWPDHPGGKQLLRRHGVLRRADLEVMGCAAPADALQVGAGWVADPGHWESLRRRLIHELDRHAAAHPLTPGISLEAARLRLGLPERGLVVRLVRPPLRLCGGRVYGAPLDRRG